MGDIKTRFSLEGEQQFKSAMTNAANAIKVLNSEQKLAKAQFQNTGDAERYAAQQATILQQKIEQQRGAVKAAEQAIKQLTDNGVSPASRQFQQWQMKLNNAQTELEKMQTELQNVNSTMQETSNAANEAGDAVESIGKNVSYDTVINGISKITGAMESAARKAAELAGELITTMKDAAAWADDLATQATVYGIDAATLQRMRYTADLLDTSVESIMKSRQKLINNMVYGNEDIQQSFKKLGITTQEFMEGKYGPVSTGYRDWADVFWEVGDALSRMDDFEEASALATKLLGKSWAELLPLFDNDWAEKGYKSAREYYEATMESWDVVSNENVAKLTALDDAVHRMDNEFTTLKNTVLAEIAPGFETLATAASDLLSEFNKYLATDEGQQKLADLSEAVVELFSEITDLDFGTAMDTAKGALNSLTSGLKWIKSNWKTVETGLRGLGLAFGLLKISEGVLTFMQLLAAGKFLFGTSAAAEAAAAGTSAGTAWGAAFAAAVMKAAPWLAFAYTLLNPAASASNDLDVMFDEGTGRLTTAGWQDYNNALSRFASTGEHDWNGWIDDLLMVGEIFEGLPDISVDENAVNAIARWRMTQDMDALISELESLGYVRKKTDAELRGSTAPEAVNAQVNADGSATLYDANGNEVGYTFAKSDKTFKKDRRTGELTEKFDYRIPESDEVVRMTKAQAEAVETFWDVWRESSDISDEDWSAYENAFKGQEALFDQIDQMITDLYQRHSKESGGFDEGLPKDLFTVEAEPVLPADANSKLQGMLNQFSLMASVSLVPSFGGLNYVKHANGLPYVPFNGYPAILHRGERVLTAREATNYNSSSNVYVETMNMNGGVDAQALADAMSARNKRVSAGFGW